MVEVRFVAAVIQATNAFASGLASGWSTCRSPTLDALGYNPAITYSSVDPDFDAAMEAFERTRRKYRNALRALAK